ncbi:hypothetical protein LTR85_005527 [Meristemomyces frigidus]|nr:hypothetical protein LTR85_005527 [Meristemomyces frigidus]
MPHIEEPLRIQPLDDGLRKDSQIGAEVVLPSSMSLLDIPSLSENEKKLLRNGLFDNGVLVIRNQHGIEPKVLVQLAKLLDDTALDFHSGGAKQVTDPNNILSQNHCTRIPRAPQVTVIGQGVVRGHEGTPDLDLKHLDHTAFHEEPLSDEAIRNGHTRPYRWHMDAPLYENLPGVATVLHALEVPDLPDQTLDFPSGEEMDIAAGATAFFSGARNFDLLTPTEQQFAWNTTVQYAPRAYEWIKDCKATADGLSIAKKGREKDESALPSFNWEKVHSFPMVWKNPANGRPHLQILGCCVYSLRTTDPATGKTVTINDLDEVRNICHGLQARVYAAPNIYAHRWRRGDLVVFHNRGLMHSITGQLSQHPERRLLWQCNIASQSVPEAYSS